MAREDVVIPSEWLVGIARIKDGAPQSSTWALYVYGVCRIGEPGSRGPVLHSAEGNANAGTSKGVVFERYPTVPRTARVMPRLDLTPFRTWRCIVYQATKTLASECKPRVFVDPLIAG